MRPWDIVTTEDPGPEAGGEECIDALRFNHAPSGTPTKSPAPNAIRSIKPTIRRLKMMRFFMGISSSGYCKMIEAGLIDVNGLDLAESGFEHPFGALGRGGADIEGGAKSIAVLIAK